MTIKCPTCKEKTNWKDNKYRPFCSDRCRLIDLGKWLDEQYSVECEDTELFSIQDSSEIH